MPTKKAPTETLTIQRFTSSEAGAWSNSYLISGVSDAILFDVFMLRGEAAELAKTIEKSGKTLRAVVISHAHPDHFMGLDAIAEHFPAARILSTANVVADIQQDGPWMFSMLQSKLGAAGPKRLIIPETLQEPVLHIGGTDLEVVEFGECESKDIASLFIPPLKAILSADLVYNGAHLYVAEKHIASWMERLDELEAFARDHVSTIHPGHGAASDLGLLALTRAYLSDFAEAVKGGNARAAEQQILGRYPEYHVRQFLTVFSIPAFFPAASSASITSTVRLIGRMQELRAILLSTVLATAMGAALSARPYTIEHYDAHITLDLEYRRLTGKETILLRSGAPALNEIELDADEIVVGSVRVGKKAKVFSQSPGHVIIHLERPLQMGNRMNLTVTFQGSPTKGLIFSGREAYTVYHTSQWLVVNHEPEDLATLRLSLSVPSGMVVVGNGENISARTVGANLISVWNEQRAIPDFVFGFAVGPFTQNKTNSGRTELRSFSAKHSADQMAQMFRAAPSALEFFSQKSGVPYPAKTYSQIMVSGKPEQELGEFTLLPEGYGETLLAHPDDEWLLAHGLAHQWWGIGLACREWADFWLNEGVATFMADVFLGERYGSARYEHEIGIAHEIYDRLRAEGEDHALCYRGKAESEVGGNLPYYKGAWVLHLLRQQLGEEVFWNGFKKYTRANWGRTVSSRDLQAAMEEAAGSSLEIFFDKWVYR